MEKVVASMTERVLERFIAPEVISKPGKISILFFYALLIIACANGASKIKTYFSMDLYVTEDFSSFEYLNAERDYFQSGMEPFTIV